MGGQIEDLSTECINDELQSAWLNCLYTFLNYVITILVLDTFENIAVKFLRQIRVKEGIDPC